MSPIDDSYHPADVFDSARRTAQQHANGGHCFNCTDSRACAQYAWALDELSRHPGGRDVLKELQIPVPVEAPTEEGQQR
ncbi:hypothetical protein [Micromonospora fulviviridis]|uniref:4Fe-4S Wbl-type domain-containing protein n=1 Tax=Micromonospora fulviviridis TaxID=47860 RepID=A0ABV2VUV0_9ACTN